MRRFIEGPYYRAIASILVFSMVCLSFPLGAIQLPTRANPNPEAPSMPDTRALSAEEMSRLSGKNNPNPYASGTNGFSVMHAGVDVLTGNFMHSATDWSVSSSLGIPATVTRTYSANNPDEGPLGKGWILSTDMRTTVGGLLKGAGAPSRSVPVTFKEHAVGGANDPHYGNATPFSSVTSGGCQRLLRGGGSDRCGRDPDDARVGQERHRSRIRDRGDRERDLLRDEQLRRAHPGGHDLRS